MTERVTEKDTATARMEAARRNRLRFIQERNLLIGILSRIWPSHLAPAAGYQTKEWRWTVCIHSPHGQLGWHITEAEADSVFAHLERHASDWDGHKHTEKLERLSLLSAEGWKTRRR